MFIVGENGLNCLIFRLLYSTPTNIRVVLIFVIFVITSFPQSHIFNLSRTLVHVQHVHEISYLANLDLHVHVSNLLKISKFWTLKTSYLYSIWLIYTHTHIYIQLSNLHELKIKCRNTNVLVIMEKNLMEQSYLQLVQKSEYSLPRPPVFYKDFNDIRKAYLFVNK